MLVFALGNDPDPSWRERKMRAQGVYSGANCQEDVHPPRIVLLNSHLTPSRPRAAPGAKGAVSVH